MAGGTQAARRGSAAASAEEEEEEELEEREGVRATTTIAGGASPLKKVMPKRRFRLGGNGALRCALRCALRAARARVSRAGARWLARAAPRARAHRLICSPHSCRLAGSRRARRLMLARAHR
jgi:hypothetical protein